MGVPSAASPSPTRLQSQGNPGGCWGSGYFADEDMTTFYTGLLHSGIAPDRT